MLHLDYGLIRRYSTGTCRCLGARQPLTAPESGSHRAARRAATAGTDDVATALVALCDDESCVPPMKAPAPTERPDAAAV